MIHSQESTKSLFEFQRKCKFEEESNLDYFPRIYTQDLCRLECRMKKFREKCGCLPFFHKRKSEQQILLLNLGVDSFWLLSDHDKPCDKVGLKCIVKNKGKSLI